MSSWVRLDPQALRELESEQADEIATARAEAHRRVEVELSALWIANDARVADAEAADPLPAWFPTVRSRIERESQKRSHAVVDAAFDELTTRAEAHLEALRREVSGGCGALSSFGAYPAAVAHCRGVFFQQQRKESDMARLVGGVIGAAVGAYFGGWVGFSTGSAIGCTIGGGFEEPEERRDTDLGSQAAHDNIMQEASECP